MSARDQTTLLFSRCISRRYRSFYDPEHIYHGGGVAFDPEGLMSTIPAIVQVIIGFFAGDYLRRKNKKIFLLMDPLIKDISSRCFLRVPI